MRIKDFKADERKDKAEFSDENEDDVNSGCMSSTDDESNDEVNIHHKIPHADNKYNLQFSKFQQECLKSHNTYRAKHGVTSLQLSRKVG